MAALPADDQLLAVLRSTFGYAAFRPLQEPIVRTLLRGEDAFVLMPTGGGKSLCYQLPALFHPRPTVVVSPLIALMKDQVDALQALGVAADFINSSLDSAEVARRQAALARGELKLVYVAPERLMTDTFLRLLQTARPVCFAIDEAHCISEWGHDFRPEYRGLRRLRALFPDAAVAAFTATATPRVQADIRAQLGLDGAASFQGSFNRPNLFYEVREKRETHRQLVAYLRGRRRDSGIIYCQSRNGTETLAARLQADGFSAVAYHAGLESEERRLRQEAFVHDDVRIIVATVAFGMGIDKPDVRFVVHYDLPRNLEGFYQESGRAGRDGEPADCVLFYSYGDVTKYRRFIAEKPSAAERRLAEQQLQLIARWANDRACRRRALLAYFGEELREQDGPCCDICRDVSGADRRQDFTLDARAFLAAVRRTGQRFGSGYVIDVLRGVENDRIRRFGHDTLKVFGRGAERSADEWRQIADELVREGYLRRVEAEYNALKLTEQGLAVLTEGTPVLLLPPRQRSRREERAARREEATGGGSYEEALFEALRALRKRLADERRVPPYVIFHDAVLRRLCEERPRTLADLLRIPGVGERKAADFGEVFLQALHEYAATAEPPARKEPTVSVTLRAFRGGQTPGEIAAARGLTVGTILGHLAQALELGEPLDLDAVVPEERRRHIERALAAAPDGRLKPVLERLGEGFSYGEVRLVQAAQRAGEG